MHRVGTLTWARSTGGRLTFGDYAQLAGMGVVSLIELMSERMRRRLGWTRRLQAGDFEPPVVPWAMELCRELSPDWLVHHCLRAYAFGALLAQRDGLRFDRELLVIICLLHDLGLVPRHAPDGKQPCFAVSGGLAAYDACLPRLGPEGAERVAEAITLHLNPVVSLASGAEAHLLRQGSACDVIGARISQLERPLREQVVARYPRLELKRCLLEAFAQTRRPGTRTDFLCRAGFQGMIRRAPFPE